MLKPVSKSKSPLTLSLLIACLVIATLVMISNYFLRPGLELDLRNRIVSKLHFQNLLNPVIKVEGRDVMLSGIVPNEGEAEKIEARIQSISGINQIDSQLFIENRTD